MKHRISIMPVLLIGIRQGGGRRQGVGVGWGDQKEEIYRKEEEDVTLSQTEIMYILDSLAEASESSPIFNKC